MRKPSWGGYVSYFKRRAVPYVHISEFFARLVAVDVLSGG